MTVDAGPARVLLKGIAHDRRGHHHRLVVLLVLLGVFFVVGFNRLRTQNVAVDEALGGVDAQLTRRADLIPNLVNTVKGYATHERAVFDEVTAARARRRRRPPRAGRCPDKAAADARLDRAVFDVLAVAEAYPDLKASTNFLQGKVSSRRPRTRSRSRVSTTTTPWPR